MAEAQLEYAGQIDLRPADDVPRNEVVVEPRSREIVVGIERCGGVVEKIEIAPAPRIGRVAPDAGASGSGPERREQPLRAEGSRRRGGGEPRAFPLVSAEGYEIDRASYRRRAEVGRAESAVYLYTMQIAEREIGDTGDAEVGVVERHSVEEEADLVRRRSPDGDGRVAPEPPVLKDPHARQPGEDRHGVLEAPVRIAELYHGDEPGAVEQPVEGIRALCLHDDLGGPVDRVCRAGYRIRRAAVPFTGFVMAGPGFPRVSGFRGTRLIPRGATRGVSRPRQGGRARESGEGANEQDPA